MSIDERASQTRAAPELEAAPARLTIPGRLDALIARGWSAFTTRAQFPYQAAIVRIGLALTFGLFLLREWPNRRVLYGDLSPWGLDLARQLLARNGAFTVLAWSDARWWFELVYAGAIVVSVLLLLGWRTRTMSVLFLVAVLSIHNRHDFVGNGGDNVVHLLAIYLVGTRCGQVWSLDARRRRLEAERYGASRPHDRTGIVLWAGLGLLLAYVQLSGFASPGMLDIGWGVIFWAFWIAAALWYRLDRTRPHGEGRALADTLANMLHNVALLVIAVEVCLVYATAGWFKVQGTLWQSGTALYYPLHTDYFVPWPGLSAILAGNPVMVFLITYGTVIVQVAFPFLVFHRWIKNVLLVVLMIEHAAIGVILGLPFFSLAMIAADAVFLPTAFLVWAGGWASARSRWAWSHVGGRWAT